jgi:hypothetical protein
MYTFQAIIPLKKENPSWLISESVEEASLLHDYVPL